MSRARGEGSVARSSGQGSREWEIARNEGERRELRKLSNGGRGGKCAYRSWIYWFALASAGFNIGIPLFSIFLSTDRDPLGDEFEMSFFFSRNEITGLTCIFLISAEFESVGYEKFYSLCKVTDTPGYLLLKKIVHRYDSCGTSFFVSSYLSCIQAQELKIHRTGKTAQLSFS